MVEKFSAKYQMMKHCAPNRTAVKKNATKFLFLTVPRGTIGNRPGPCETKRDGVGGFGK